jgi:SAM-dependent methyltransferase
MHKLTTGCFEETSHMKQGVASQQQERFEGRSERERIHFNRLAQLAGANSLWMDEQNIRRYANPPATTPFPLEYVFHLLGPLQNKTVVDLGCGEGLNTVILAALGAHVISVDISDESLRLTEERARVNKVNQNITFLHADAAGIPIENNTADLVLCCAILHHVDCVAVANQLRRFLKPGGRAVFLEPLRGPELFAAMKNALPKAPDVSDDECPLTMAQVMAVSEAIGIHGRSRVFGLTNRLFHRLGIRSMVLARAIHHVDASLLRAAPFLQPLASPLAWEARKAG